MGDIVKLESSDSKVFEVSKKVAEQSITVKHMLEDILDDNSDAADSPIPLPNVRGETLAKVIEYCEHHKDDSDGKSDGENKEKSGDKSTDEISAWDKEFCNVKQSTLFELILAANYLDIKPLLDVTCKTVANMIEGKTTEEIRKVFNIKNDFTPEEEANIRKENEWCMDL